MDVQSLFEIYHMQYDQVDRLWNYFGVISMGTAGFVIGSDKATATIREPILILVSYLTFTAGNYSALITGHALLYDLSLNLKASAADVTNLSLSNLKIYPPADVTQFYWGMVLVFCIVIGLVSYFRLKEKQSG